jgi:tetratricopeptide (TPR) repeat protein
MQKEEFYKLLDSPGLLDSETLHKLEMIVHRFPFFQAAWILYLKNLFVTGSPDFQLILRRAAIGIPDRKKLFSFIHCGSENMMTNSYFEQAAIGSQSLPGTGNKSKPEGQLIDKFLSRDNKSIKLEQQDQKNYSGENEILERSVTETDELITETLAMIYFDQKKYDKAIDAFKKLSLKYPEKSVYFANRIEEIEKLKRI